MANRLWGNLYVFCNHRYIVYPTIYNLCIVSYSYFLRQTQKRGIYPSLVTLFTPVVQQVVSIKGTSLFVTVQLSFIAGLLYSHYPVPQAVCPAVCIGSFIVINTLYSHFFRHQYHSQGRKEVYPNQNRKRKKGERGQDSCGLTFPFGDEVNLLWLAMPPRP